MVLVSSRSNRDEYHAARKSWLTMVCSDPPTVGLCCRLSHRTAINILETREFVINIPGEEIAERVARAGDSVWEDAQRSPAGWTFIPSERVSAPRVDECRGHIECVLESTRRFNDDELIFFARIRKVLLDESLLRGEPDERYRALRSLVYLEDGLYGVIDNIKKLPG